MALSIEDLNVDLIKFKSVFLNNVNSESKLDVKILNINYLYCSKNNY